MLLAKKIENDLIITYFKGRFFSLNLSTMSNTIHMWDKNIKIEGTNFWIDEFDVLFGGWCPKSERKERSRLLTNPRNFRIMLEIDKMRKINKMWIDGNQIKLNAQLYFSRSLNKRITNPLNSIQKLFRPYKACGIGKGIFWEVPITNLIWFMKDLGLEEEIRKLKEKF